MGRRLLFFDIFGMALRIYNLLPRLARLGQVRFMCDTLGSGSGKGGGAGGSIREAGGSFGKMEAAREEEYFRRKQAEQLSALKDSIHDEIDYHQKEIREHEEAMQRHKDKLKQLKDLEH